jgi:hypothetical protein
MVLRICQSTESEKIEEFSPCEFYDGEKPEAIMVSFEQVEYNMFFPGQLIIALVELQGDSLICYDVLNKTE